MKDKNPERIKKIVDAAFGEPSPLKNFETMNSDEKDMVSFAVFFAKNIVKELREETSHCEDAEKQAKEVDLFLQESSAKKKELSFPNDLIDAIANPVSEAQTKAVLAKAGFARSMKTSILDRIKVQLRKSGQWFTEYRPRQFAFVVPIVALTVLILVYYSPSRIEKKETARIEFWNQNSVKQILPELFGSDVSRHSFRKGEADKYVKAVSFGFQGRLLVQVHPIQLKNVVIQIADKLSSGLFEGGYTSISKKVKNLQVKVSEERFPPEEYQAEAEKIRLEIVGALDAEFEEYFYIGDTLAVWMVKGQGFEKWSEYEEVQLEKLRKRIRENGLQGLSPSLSKIIETSIGNPDCGRSRTDCKIPKSATRNMLQAIQE